MYKNRTFCYSVVSVFVGLHVYVSSFKNTNICFKEIENIVLWFEKYLIGLKNIVYKMRKFIKLEQYIVFPLPLPYFLKDDTEPRLKVELRKGMPELNILFLTWNTTRKFQLILVIKGHWRGRLKMWNRFPDEQNSQISKVWSSLNCYTFELTFTQTTLNIVMRL